MNIDLEDGLILQIDAFKYYSENLAKQTLSLPRLSEKEYLNYNLIIEAEYSACAIKKEWCKMRKELDDLIFLLDTYIRSASKIKKELQ